MTDLNNDDHLHVNPFTGFSTTLNKIHPLFSQPIIARLNALQGMCYEFADQNNWHKKYPKKEDYANPEAFERAKIDWTSSKLLLVVSEIVEAQDELRSGRKVTEVYYRSENGDVHTEQMLEDGVPQYKPEGFGVELADAVIRILDLCGVVGVLNLGELIMEKLEYNATRGAMHGGKLF